jgi:glutamine synthetase
MAPRRWSSATILPLIVSGYSQGRGRHDTNRAERLRMKETSSFAEPQAFLEKHPAIRHVDALCVDVCGTPRGKRYPADKLKSLYADGLQMPQSHFLLDVNGDNSDPVGRGYTDGDPDTTLYPVPGTLVPVPWVEGSLAQVVVSERPNITDRLQVDSRQVLARVAGKLAEIGLTPVMAVELEFYLFEREPDGEGRPQRAKLPNGLRLETTNTNSVSELEYLGAFLGDLEDFCRVQQIPASIVTSEMAAGQFEINLQHVASPLAAGDHAFLLRRVVQAAALRHGMRASFMSKPFLDVAGSGMHVHVSLADAKGVNQFDDGGDSGTALLRQAIGGLQQTMPETLAFFAPNTNAFRRFGPMQFVPLNRLWGYNNRAVAFRVPAGPSSARRIEHRVAGADANPHLVLAAILAGMHLGMRFDLTSAIKRLAGSELLAGYFDPAYLKAYAAVKINERARFLDYIARREYDWYL